MKYIKKFENLKYYNIDAIVDEYIETALWTNDDEIPDYLGIYDVSIDSRNRCKEEIEWFIDMCGDIINDTEDKEIGKDLWLTRNGHGSGFFDKSYDKDDLLILEELSRLLGPVEVYYDVKIIFHSSDRYKNIDVNELKKKLEIVINSKKYNL